MNGIAPVSHPKLSRIAKHILTASLLLFISSCGSRNPEAIEKLNELHSRLDVGMNYREYGKALGDIKVVLDKKADKKAERSFQAHLYSYDFWKCQIDHTRSEFTEEVACHGLTAIRFDGDFEGFDLHDDLMANITNLTSDEMGSRYMQEAWLASQMVLDGDDPGQPEE